MSSAGVTAPPVEDDSNAFSGIKKDEGFVKAYFGPFALMLENERRRGLRDYSRTNARKPSEGMLDICTNKSLAFRAAEGLDDIETRNLPTQMQRTLKHLFEDQALPSLAGVPIYRAPDYNLGIAPIKNPHRKKPVRGQALNL